MDALIFKYWKVVTCEAQETEIRVNRENRSKKEAKNEDKCE